MKLLLIEDDAGIAKNIQKGLELSGYSVDVAGDGETGYDLASEESYSVIILDRMLPKMDGATVCADLRRDGVSTPILMLTALSQTNDTVEGLKIGADDYLAKPFEFAELQARIEALSRRQDKPIVERLAVGDLELDYQAVTVKRSGTPVQLTQREFALLEFLMRHPNQVFSKEQLVEKVWPYDSNILPNTVQVYVGYLRTKIDAAFPKKPKLIHSVRGFGYTLKSSE